MGEHYWLILRRIALLDYGQRMAERWNACQSSETMGALASGVWAALEVAYMDGPGEWVRCGDPDCPGHDERSGFVFTEIMKAFDSLSNSIASAFMSGTAIAIPIGGKRPRPEGETVYSDDDLPEVVISPRERVKA